MSFVSEHVSAGPGDRLRDAAHVTADFLSDFIPTAGRHITSDDDGKSARIEQLVESHAWIDAALALVEIELPQWQVRRLVYDGGEWFCSLSRNRELPDWLDQPVEAHHADLAQAILGAHVEARRITLPLVPSVSAMLRDADPLWQTINCENLG